MNNTCLRPRRARLVVPWMLILAGGCFPAWWTKAEPPVVAAPQDAFAWTVEVQHKKTRHPPDPAQAASYKRLMDSYPLLLTESAEKVGANWHRVKVYDNKRKDEVWVYKGAILFQFDNFPPDKVSVVSTRDPASPVKPDFGPCFPELGWVRQEVFVKTVNFHGHRCDYYEDKTAPLLEGGDRLNPSTTTGVQAWIDVQTRLPIAIEDATMIKKFSYPEDKPAAVVPTGIFANAYHGSAHQTNLEKSDSPDAAQ